MNPSGGQSAAPVTLCRVADYFGEPMLNRQRLLWTVATRRQLERWEPLVAASLRASIAHRSWPDADLWASEVERHFALVAAHNLLVALELSPASKVEVDSTLHDELIEGRHLNEHWDENMPIFNARPRMKQPGHKTGREFAHRNPDRGPYSQANWNLKRGAMLLPNVAAADLHGVLDDVEAEVLASDPALSRFLPPREPSPWLHHNGEWWPKPDED